MQLNVEHITLADIRGQLTDTLVSVSTVFVMISMLASFSRMPVLGFLPVMYLHAFIGLLFLSVFFAKNHLSHSARGTFLCSMFFIGGVAGIHNFGLSAGGTIFLYACGVVSSMVLNLRAAISFNIGGAMVFVSYAIALAYFDFEFAVDVGPYGTSLSSWVVYIISYVFVNSIVLYLTTKLFKYLTSMIELQQSNIQEKEVELSYSQTILNTVLNNLPYGILWKDKKLNYAGANKQFLDEMKVNDVSDIIGQTDGSFFSKDEAERLLKLEQQLLSSENKKLSYEEKVNTDDGDARYRDVMHLKMHSDEGEFVGILVSYHDVTEAKLLQQKTEDAMLLAEEGNKAKSQFLANISHEIRTPMNGVYGLIDLCLNTELSAEQKGHLEKASASIKVLTSIINDILDLSKIEANQLELEHIPFSFKQLLSDTQVLFEKQASDKGLYLETDYFGQEDVRVLGDPTRISQILFNLTSNAIKFTSSGKVNITIKSLAYNGLVTTKIYVQDSGTGIAKKNLTKIFDAFTQAELATTRESGGSGLGLSIVKRLVEQMEGLITVKSSVGVGTKFCITLRHKLENIEQRVDTFTRTRVDLKGKRILVVDDNLINIEIAGAMLSQNQVEVSSAYNGVEALEYLEDHKVDLVLLDIAMPIMDGCECMKRIRANDALKNLPVIALTANVMASDIALYEQLGFNDCVPKPYERAQLLEAVAKHIN
ncbi:response regulator [Glaciecola sp. MH2013]|uniref:PAS domain-containing hybrid sensor histidine kinase/response regulator n=1 Tax=Glaciecola sp. MH2013 TaxID=2785524 RepID=UPI0018A10AA3|nr:PAS domain-containing hybrid sensor histidine kinase/response regulator [Glaciecola sp. MH2013]MBF7074107.1 response regulator [Glaciecola sp. MH2013]